MPKVICRKTTNFDLVDRLDEKIFKEDADEDGLELSTIWWVLEVNDRIAGFAGLKPGAEGSVRYGYLAKAGILEEFRGIGLQRALIDVRDKEGKRLGLDMNITYTADWNLKSANNLIRCGYELYSPENKWGLKKALYFRKRF